MILRSQNNPFLQDRGKLCGRMEQDGPECGAQATRHLCVAQLEDDGSIRAGSFYNCAKHANWGRGLVFSHELSPECGMDGTHAWYDTKTGDNGCQLAVSAASPTEVAPE